MSQKRGPDLDASKLQYYMPGMPSMDPDAGRLGRILTRIFRRRGGRRRL